MTGSPWQGVAMRADRLVAILLMLQSRGQVTAAEVADELEISERTARRDLESLAMAGLPVYSKQGRNGGWQLLGGATTDLSGLTASEARALFLVAGPASSATPQVKAALRKLMRALPEPFRTDAEAASAAVVVDPSAWGATTARPDPPHLDALQHAVISGQQVELGYTAADGSTTTRVIHPLGLAAKRNVWYLVADTDAGQRTFRVERVRSVTTTGDPVVRPEGFDLAAAWADISAEVPGTWDATRALGRAQPDAVQILRWVFGRKVRLGPPEDDGRIPFEVAGRDEWTLAGQLAGLGGRVEMTEPEAVISRLAELGAELVAIYQERSA
jgi:predicted DNA-binding transcriptional regulator YafY